MSRTKLGFFVLVAALVSGVLGDLLLRAVPWGINFPLWIWSLTLFVLVLAHVGGMTFSSEGRWLLILAVLFAAFVAWRAAPMLVFLNISAVIVVLSLATLRAREGSLKEAGISEYALGGLYTVLCAAAGPVPVAARDVDWREAAGYRSQPTLAALRGAILAAPLLLLFGALFVAADAVFERLVLQIFDFDSSLIFGHLLLAVFFAWISAGLMRLTLVGDEPAWTKTARSTNFSLGAVEVWVVLSLLNLLFLVFVAVQVRYLFGGAELVSATGLTYAEYARRGFFELVAVTALVLPLLLAAHWIFHPASRFQRRIFTALAGSLLVLLLTVMASTVYRMWLYFQAFGLTEPRFYSTAFMVWLAFALTWFTITVLLQNRRGRFAFGALLSGLATVILLNFVNPDATIARVNLNRLEAGGRFDPYYLGCLSPDAAPVLVKALPEIEPRDARILRRELRFTKEQLDETDWRSWNLSRHQAQTSI